MVVCARRLAYLGTFLAVLSGWISVNTVCGKVLLFEECPVPAVLSQGLMQTAFFCCFSEQRPKVAYPRAWQGLSSGQ